MIFIVEGNWTVREEEESSQELLRCLASKLWSEVLSKRSIDQIFELPIEVSWGSAWWKGGRNKFEKNR